MATPEKEVPKMDKNAPPFGSAFRQFNQIDGQIGRAYHKVAVKMGLSDSVFWILYTLVTYGPDTVLVWYTGLSKTTVNSALKKLERDGTLRLSPGKGHSTLVQLTEEGLALAKNTVGKLIRQENRIYEALSPEDLTLLLRLSREYADQLAALVEGL